jgi:hypothetical protein
MAQHKDSVEHVSTDLQIEEHIQLQERGWQIQAAGLLFILALVIAAAIGLFGDGVISKRRSDENNASIEYQRFHRFESRMALDVDITDAKNGATISFPNEYLKSIEIESILPAPKNNISNEDRVLYNFEGHGRMHISFHLIPRTPGNIHGQINVNDHNFPLQHFIFP